ncbi:MAG: amidohydrolase family protein [Lachnospiraceae bacterium]|nr:amidohydrolase family protein [Lachnospiraceae bacterium]
MVIDFHTHTFPDKIAGNVIGKLQLLSRSRPYTDATAGGLQRSMKEASIDYSVTLPVMTNPGQVEKLNTLAGEAIPHIQETGIIPFGGMHPDYDNYKAELRRLRDLGVPGIKIHPAYQNVDFDDIRFLRIMDAASELGLIILTHAGMDIGIPGHNFTSISQIHHVLKEVAPQKLVLAHMGGWDGWMEVEQDLAGAPVWLDTAFTLGMIEPAPGTDRTPEESMMMTAEDFLRLARRHGTDRILFATDSPWSSQIRYRNMFQAMDLTPEERRGIMGENARRLLNLTLESAETL